MRKLRKALLILLLVVLLVAVGGVGYLSLTEYRPADVETLETTVGPRHQAATLGKKLTLVSMNTGYAGLGRDADFFADGGKGVRAESEAVVRENMAGILSALAQQDADLYFLQEVDRGSTRSCGTDQLDYYAHGLSMGTAFACNYKCDWVPFPWPMLGRVESGLMTLSDLQVTQATRVSLPVPFQWPVSVANLKRCLLVERVPIEGSERELVLINLHLEAYDDGTGKAEQTAQLVKLMREEYAKGNYVVAGGDFNQCLPGSERYPIRYPERWQPSALVDEDLPDGFAFVCDARTPTCRLLNQPYTGDRSTTGLFVIDGFIVSANVKVNLVETIDLNFANSDHHPVRLEFTLAPKVDGGANRGEA